VSRSRRIVQSTRSAVAHFLATEASGGIFLLVATALALVWANVGLGYESFWHREFPLAGIEKDLQHWVNDGLMTIFFFVVGLEIKREIVAGELQDARVAILPTAAAVGGMAVPALVFLAISGGGGAAKGWAIPMATDIAFVVGALALMGSRVPEGLRIFLLTLAIVDDIGAIVVIALFYSRGIEPLWIAAAVWAISVVLFLRLLRISHPLAYVIPGFVAWASMLASGVHPTLAGVALGLLTPAVPVGGRMVLENLERWLHPLSSHVIVPIFALANAGLLLTAESVRDAVSSRVFWAVVGGLVVGKTAGVAGLSWLTLRLRIGRMPGGISVRDLVGGASLAGIGFTVSLFIAGLAFERGPLADQARLGIMAGSLVSAAAGAIVLLVRRPDPERVTGER
jgi:NhaA family Na+:H+ antiporter